MTVTVPPSRPLRPPAPAPVSRRPHVALDAALARVAPVSLAELEAAAALLTRVDRKYVLPPAVAAALVERLGHRSVVLMIGPRRRFEYRSLYFDTRDRASYRGAATGRRQRFKVRTRLYDDHETCVLEVKVPGTRGETVKDRIPYRPADRNHLTAEGRAFVDERTRRPGLGTVLAPVLQTTYQRSTLVDQGDGARITFDRALACTDPARRQWRLDDWVIVETKSAGAATEADRWLWRSGQRPVRISKFCVGMAVLDPRLPANRWHRVLRRYGGPPPTGH